MKKRGKGKKMHLWTTLLKQSPSYFNPLKEPGVEAGKAVEGAPFYWNAILEKTWREYLKESGSILRSGFDQPMSDGVIH